MRFLVDECCDFAVVKALQTAGYDVMCVSDIMPRADDSEVIELAVREKRIVVTEDKDFGQLIYAYGHKIPGVFFKISNISSQEHCRRCRQGSKSAREELNRLLYHSTTGSNPHYPHTTRLMHYL
jgi:predicted nuclease of predicted toxin-antitoxin system